MKKSELKKLIREELLKETKADFDVNYKKMRIVIKNGHKYDETEDKLAKLYSEIGKLVEKFNFYPTKTITISD